MFRESRGREALPLCPQDLAKGRTWKLRRPLRTRISPRRSWRCPCSAAGWAARGAHRGFPFLLLPGKVLCRSSDQPRPQRNILCVTLQPLSFGFLMLGVRGLFSGRSAFELHCGHPEDFPKRLMAKPGPLQSPGRFVGPSVGHQEHFTWKYTDPPRSVLIPRM